MESFPSWSEHAPTILPCCAVITCRLSHVILQERTLILLHCPSTVNSCTRSTSFHSMAAAPQRHRQPCCLQMLQTLPQAWKRDAQQGRRKLERSLSQLSFSSAWWCAVIYDTLSLDPHWLPAPPTTTSLIQTLSLHWFPAIWRVKALRAITSVNKQAKTPSYMINFWMKQELPLLLHLCQPGYSLPDLRIYSSSIFSCIFRLNPQVFLHGHPLICLSLSACHPSAAVFLLQRHPPPPPSHLPFSFFFHFLSEGKSLHHSLTGHSQSPSVSDSRC